MDIFKLALRNLAIDLVTNLDHSLYHLNVIGDELYHSDIFLDNIEDYWRSKLFLNTFLADDIGLLDLIEKMNE